MELLTILTSPFNDHFDVSDSLDGFLGARTITDVPISDLVYGPRILQLIRHQPLMVLGSLGGVLMCL